MKRIYYDGESKILKRMAEILNSKPEIGEGHEDAYYGDYGKMAYLHSQLRSGNPHNVTLADLGLSGLDDDLDSLNDAISTLESELSALEDRVEALESGQGGGGGGGDNSVFIMKEQNGVIQYNTLYLNDVYAVYAQNTTTQQNLEHLQNGSFLSGSGTIWKMSGGAIQPTAASWFRSMTFTQPITLTNETALKIKYSYTTSYTYRNFQVSLWENVNPSTILALSFGTGTIVSNYETIVTSSSPAQSASTVYSIDVSALQGKTIWIHFFTSDVIPLITEIWCE